MNDNTKKALIAGGGAFLLLGAYLSAKAEEIPGEEIPGEEIPEEPEEGTVPVLEFACPYCGQVFASEIERNLHINYDHPSIEPGDPSGPDSLIVYSNLRCTPKSIYLGESATIKVTVTQMGTVTETVEVFLGSETGLSKKVTLGPGESKTLSWVYTPNDTGSYDITVGEYSLVLGVTNPPVEDPTDPNITSMASYIPSGIIWTMRHTKDGPVFGVPPEHANWIKHSGGYREAVLSNVFDYSSDNSIQSANPGVVYRDLIAGSLMWSGKHVEWQPGNTEWFWRIAMLRYIDDKCPNGWFHEGIWNQYRPLCVKYPGEPGTGNSTSWMCSYFPPYPA